jgi:signal peptidase I
MQQNQPQHVAENTAVETEQPKKKSFFTELLSWLKELAIAFVAVALVCIFLIQPVRVEGTSMCDTLQNGEIMLVNKAEYLFSGPKRHDVVICYYPGRYMDKWKLLKQYFVKRIIALPGETIAIEEGVVYINGQPLEESYLSEEMTRRKTSMEPRTLAQDEYFVMGDNRDNSNDSRRIGPVKRKAIIGRVRRVLWPLKRLWQIR